VSTRVRTLLLRRSPDASSELQPDARWVFVFPVAAAHKHPQPQKARN
jgi:hypothetical protein